MLFVVEKGTQHYLYKTQAPGMPCRIQRPAPPPNPFFVARATDWSYGTRPNIQFVYQQAIAFLFHFFFGFRTWISWHPLQTYSPLVLSWHRIINTIFCTPTHTNHTKWIPCTVHNQPPSVQIQLNSRFCFRLLCTEEKNRVIFGTNQDNTIKKSEQENKRIVRILPYYIYTYNILEGDISMNLAWLLLLNRSPYNQNRRMN